MIRPFPVVVVCEMLLDHTGTERDGTEHSSMTWSVIGES